MVIMVLFMGWVTRQMGRFAECWRERAGASRGDRPGLLGAYLIAEQLVW
jgi:hypothetical protein